uniref:Uncharacterized protein n=1 Tax=Cacopsylla melanoneura TaxID=428564 RepID=A0A8D8R4Z4_9HEMI
MFSSPRKLKRRIDRKGKRQPFREQFFFLLGTRGNQTRDLGVEKLFGLFLHFQYVSLFLFFFFFFPPPPPPPSSPPPPPPLSPPPPPPPLPPPPPPPFPPPPPPPLPPPPPPPPFFFFFFFFKFQISREVESLFLFRTLPT